MASQKRSTPTNKNAMTYAQSGVDIEAGDEVVGLIKHHMRRTYGPRVLGQHGAFAGCFRLDFNEKLFKRNYKDPVLVACTDGVGTKVLLAVEMGVLDSIGQDCVAMNVNDMIVQGAEPLFFLDYVAVHEVIPRQTADIIKGVADGCSLAGCALLGGETSEMRDVYKKGDFDLAGFAVGVVELKKAIAGPERVAAGDVVLGLASSGIHSNGYSLVRAIIKKKRLKLDKVYKQLETSQTLGEVLLEPTRIYVKPIIEVLHKYKVKKPISGMAHITGGGLPGNLNRSLSAKLDAKLDKKSWGIPPVFKFLQDKGNVSDEEMFKVFNMGIGYTLIVRPHFADAITRQLKRAGETVYRLGEIVPGSGRVKL
ncbi:MAG: phosphoribosylformylglycinamidine cyclo-ligase [Planctomycetota bacterium]